jgi:hypothetical protein
MLNLDASVRVAHDAMHEGLLARSLENLGSLPYEAGDRGDQNRRAGAHAQLKRSPQQVSGLVLRANLDGLPRHFLSPPVCLAGLPHQLRLSPQLFGPPGVDQAAHRFDIHSGLADGANVSDAVKQTARFVIAGADNDCMTLRCQRDRSTNRARQLIERCDLPSTAVLFFQTLGSDDWGPRRSRTAPDSRLRRCRSGADAPPTVSGAARRASACCRPIGSNEPAAT